MIKSNIQWNCKQISKMYDAGSLKFDNAIQRGNVWDIKRQSLLIDSIIKGYPIPAFYTIKLEEKIKTNKGLVNVFDCIDGKQRCNAISKFRNNELALSGLDTYIGENGEVDLNGKKYEDLDEDIKDIFDSYSLTVYFFTDITEEEIAEMMNRLNNGKPLTGIENARIKAKDLSEITKLAKHPLFSDHLTEKAINGYVNEDIVIKTYMQVVKNEYELSSKCVKGTYESADFNSDVVEKLNTIFDMVYKIANTVKVCTGKKTYKKVVSKTNLVAVINFVSLKLDCGIEILENFIIDFFDTDNATISDDYNNACKDGTNHSNKVIARNTAIYTEFSKKKEK